MSTALDRLAAALADRYRLERELGQGGMATVYLAHDIRHDRKVAIKVLRPELAAVIGAERFLSEIKTTANLQHPHILPLFDSGAADSFLFYVMPYVEGISLRDRMTREKQLPIAESVRIASEIASALDYAHRHGVIHRDIKPENILLHDGSALVADFGIALAASKAGSRMTETGMSLGTPQYMSPEQAMGERELDARSDVYALGCVTYEMLTGEPPFTGPTAQAIVAKVMTAEPAEVTSLRRTIPVHVGDAVHTALQKLPADRFASAREFSDALGGTGSAHRATTTRIRAAGTRPGQRVPLLVGGVAMLAMLTGVAGTLLLRPAASPSGRTARMHLRLEGGQAQLGPSGLPNLAAAPDGSGIIHVGPGTNITSQLFLRRWDRLAEQPIAQVRELTCCVTYSPSGDSIAYITAPRLLNVVALNGGLPRTLPELGLISMTDVVGGLDWGSDGKVYAVGTGGLLRIDIADDKAEMVAPFDTARGDLYFLAPHVLPRANGAVVTIIDRRAPTDPTQASIGIADFATGQVAVVAQGMRAIYSPTGHLIVVRSTGVVWAVPFDAGALKVTGTARELADTVAVRTANAAAGFVDIALSNDGTLSYVSGAANTYEYVWVDRSGNPRTLFPDITFPVANAAAISSDGRLALGMGGEDGRVHQWIAPADGGRPVRLTFDGGANLRPQWRPGTGTITYTSDRELPGETKLQLFEQSATGQGPIRRVTTGDPRRVGGHSWSPDGTWLLVRTDDQEPGGGDILAIRPGIDSVARPLVATPAEELAPAISPDGRWMAYTSNESGARRQVFVRPFPETGNARYQVSTAGGIAPVWNPAGGELFYTDDAQRMIAVPVTTGATFQTGTPKVLFSVNNYALSAFHPHFAVSRDGSRFLMTRDRAAAEYGIVTVFNFLDELKRLMAEK